jgi:hypothetical protein
MRRPNANSGSVPERMTDWARSARQKRLPERAKGRGNVNAGPLARLVYAATVDERQFFTEKPEQRPARFQCPRCRRTNDYTIRWMRRTKKAQLPAGADARDRTLFGKVKDHLIRIDDDVTCKTCGKKFEIPSHRALVFLEELEGLPQEDYDE